MDLSPPGWSQATEHNLAVLKAKIKINNLSESGRNRPKTYDSLRKMAVPTLPREDDGSDYVYGDDIPEKPARYMCDTLGVPMFLIKFPASINLSGESISHPPSGPAICKL